jgi:lipopolysaccharide/colanic/teichoic acid biosynthesis glycosyltransferase
VASDRQPRPSTFSPPVSPDTSHAQRTRWHRDSPTRWKVIDIGALDGAVRRALDFTLTSLLLVLLAPVMFVIAVLIRITTRGPVLFRQWRIGRDERPFRMLKFRTMYTGSDQGPHRDYVTRLMTELIPPRDEEGLYKLVSDDRVTPVGAILRRTSCDELPQLFNVLMGKMSLVGPRPALPWERQFYSPEHFIRFSVRPGLTGLWQVSGRNCLTMKRALDLDVEYARRHSLGLYLAILARTPLVVLTGRGAR